MNLLRILPLLLGLAVSAVAADAPTGKIIKVLPQFLDKEGRVSLTPSLYTRDAYQAELRARPEQRSGLRFMVQWKASDASTLAMKVEMRGLRTNETTTVTLESALVKDGWFSTWTELTVHGDEYKKFGEMVAWRVTLWDGKTELAEQKSFMW
jgi:hypothetical protein